MPQPMIEPPPASRSMPPREWLSVGVCLDTDEGFSKRVLLGFEDYRRERKPREWRYHGGCRSGFTLPGSELPNFKVDALVGYFSSLDIIREHEAVGMPIVSLQSWDMEACRSPRLLLDERATGAMAALHLLSQGYKNFAYYGNLGAPWMTHKLWGFEKELQDKAGRKVRESLLHNYTDLGWQTCEELRSWIKELPPETAVFCWNDFYAHLLCEVALENGLKIPQDLAIIGVNDDPFCLSVSEVQISSIDVGPRRLGRRMAELLAAQIDGNLPPSTTEVLSPIKVVPRESSLRESPATNIVLQALSYLRSHYTQHVSMQELARRVGASQRTLNRHFSAALATTPKAELTNLRLERSKELLTNDALSIATIAEQIGFPDERSYVLSFKRHLGLTPSSYRKRPNSQSHDISSTGHGQNCALFGQIEP